MMGCLFSWLHKMWKPGDNYFESELSTYCGYWCIKWYFIDTNKFIRMKKSWNGIWNNQVFHINVENVGNNIHRFDFNGG